MFLPSVWLVLEGGQVHVVAWELDLIKCSGLVAWDVGHGSHFLSLRQRAEESQRTANSMAAVGVVWHALQFTCSFAYSLCETRIFTSRINKLHLNPSACAGVTQRVNKRERNWEVHKEVQKYSSTAGKSKEKKQKQRRQDEKRQRSYVLSWCNS